VWVYVGLDWEQKEVEGKFMGTMGSSWEQKDFDELLMETRGI
jgi:hypothetical protein